jgi:hypothetical protein
MRSLAASITVQAKIDPVCVFRPDVRLPGDVSTTESDVLSCH